MNRIDIHKQLRHSEDLLKRGFASMLQGGVIMDVVTPEQAAVAEAAGAVSVMALERVPADIRKSGGVARTSHPDMIKGIIDCTSIPVMAKSRIGHFVEAQILESIGVDFIDESEVLTPADDQNHINKQNYKSYLEIGCDNDENFSRISIENKIGVDPSKGGTLRMTSDEFFKINKDD